MSTDKGTITIVGLGPGASGLITADTWDKLIQAKLLLLKTQFHPAVIELQTKNIFFESYDELYETQPSLAEAEAAAAADCLARAGRGEPVVYAVPGSPLVAEQSVAFIRREAVRRGIGLTVLPAMSFLEVLYTRLGLDPLHGPIVSAAADLEKLAAAVPTGLVITQLTDWQAVSAAKLALSHYFPDDWPVSVVRRLGWIDEQISTLPLQELDQLVAGDQLTSVYVPPRLPDGTAFQLEPLVAVMARLRSPGGCVWDMEQSHASLRRYLVEEVYEVLEAIDLEDGEAFCEELGDLLLQIVFHARVAEESGVFSMQDVVNGVTEKLLRRHPHVFGDISVQDAAEVVLNWEAIKKLEKGHSRPSVLDGVPKDLPALMRAYKLQTKAAKVGFDWESITPVWDKITEELDELRAAVQGGDNSRIEDEMGDVLFSLVNLARFLHVEAEIALNGTNNKFRNRFQYMENRLAAQDQIWTDFNLEELDKLWHEAKIKLIPAKK